MTQKSNTPPDTDSEIGIAPPDDDPFFYGYRYVVREQDGEEDWEQVPLTLEDVLHPELEDHVSQNRIHDLFCHYLFTILWARMRHNPSIAVLHDVLLNWGKEGIGNHSPDVAVLHGVHTDYPHGVFDVEGSGGKPLLLIEVTSVNTRIADVDNERRKENKYRQYAQVGVPWYLIVDAVKYYPGGPPPPLMLYRLVSEEVLVPRKPTEPKREEVGNGQGASEDGNGREAHDPQQGNGFAVPPKQEKHNGQPKQASEEPVEMVREVQNRYEPVEPDARGWLWVEPVGLYLGPREGSFLQIAWYDQDGQMLLNYDEREEQWEAESQRAEAESRRAEAEAKARAEAEARLRALEEELRRLRGE